MRLVEGRLVLGATDLSDYIACEHLTQLEIRRAHGEDLPRSTTQLAQLLATLGGEHETQWVEERTAAGIHVHSFDPETTRSATTLAQLEHAAADTASVMRDGTSVLYQPFFFDGTWQARADFLVRVDRPSALGGFSYEVYDAKLARHVRVEALLQLCEYSLQLSRIQGMPPEQMHVVLGDGTTRSFLVSDFAAYHRAIRAQFQEALLGSETYPQKVAHCSVCDYAQFCDARRRADSHLSLVARMRRDQVRKLNLAGVGRVEELARLAPDAGVTGMAQATLDSLREQARLQVAGGHRGDAPPLWELLPQTEAGFGLEALPEPSPHDVCFDMEGDAFSHEEPIEYLFGVAEASNGTHAYQAFQGHTVAEERRAFEAFIDWLIARLDAHPAMHVFHYGDYERSALQRLMGRHGTREAEVDRLLRGGVLVDLYRVVRQSLRLSTESYGLKQVERLYMPHRSGDVADGESSLVMYARWVRDRDPALLESIVRYNEVDCVSTMGLRSWLEARRTELVLSGAELTRPSVRDGAPPPQVAEESDATTAVVQRLLRNVPEDAALRPPAQQATWLLAQLLGYHRREQKVEWWRWFGHIAMTEDELAEDREALGPLEYVGLVDTVKKSVIERYRFAPQEHAIRDGSRPAMPWTRDGARDAVAAGTVVAVDNVAGTIDLRRGNGMSERGHPRFLIPPTPIGAKAQAASLLALGTFVAEHGLELTAQGRAALDLLLRVPPRGAGGGALRTGDESAEDAAVRVASRLDGGCLAVQGPPGAGKTYTAAQIAIRLAEEGKRVAVTATAHKVISRLLGEIAGAAAERGQPLRIVQKCDEDEFCDALGATRAPRKEEVVAALDAGVVDIVGGTAWVFADECVAGRFDTLIVDEAAQMSLADVVACSRCARNVVLVGDPRQLAQVVQGSHPTGVGVSALAHLLQDRATVAADTGIFLDRTWRMAPEVCAFVSDAFYQGRLEAVEDAARQWVVDGADAPPLRGLYSIPVAHDGDRTYSPAEAARVREVFEELIGRRWRHRDGTERALGVQDILVVAPYNAHVACLAAALPKGARVGTVDRFQGQEAAVSIFSLATSSAEELPRNLEFLYSTHRLNVAVSRARCVSALVYSPALLRTHCRTPEQMRLVNALCRYVEAAAPWPEKPAATGAPRQLSLLAV